MSPENSAAAEDSAIEAGAATVVTGAVDVTGLIAPLVGSVTRQPCAAVSTVSAGGSAAPVSDPVPALALAPVGTTGMCASSAGGNSGRRSVHVASAPYRSSTRSTAAPLWL